MPPHQGEGRASSVQSAPERAPSPACEPLRGRSRASTLSLPPAPRMIEVEPECRNPFERPDPWPPNLMEVVAATARSSCPRPNDPEFQFDLTSGAAAHNMGVLRKYNLDFKAALEAQQGTPLSYGSEFRTPGASLREPPKLAEIREHPPGRVRLATGGVELRRQKVGPARRSLFWKPQRGDCEPVPPQKTGSKGCHPRIRPGAPSLGA